MAAERSGAAVRFIVLSGAPYSAIEAPRIRVMDVLVLDIAILEMVRNCLFQLGTLYNFCINHHAV